MATRPLKGSTLFARFTYDHARVASYCKTFIVPRPAQQYGRNAAAALFNPRGRARGLIIRAQLRRVAADPRASRARARALRSVRNKRDDRLRGRTDLHSARD